MELRIALTCLFLAGAGASCTSTQPDGAGGQAGGGGTTHTTAPGGSGGSGEQGCYSPPAYDVGPDDASHFGFSALDALDWVNQRGAGVLQWHDGTSTSLSIEAAIEVPAELPGGPIHVFDHPDDPADWNLPPGYVYCAEFMAIPVRVSFVTVDGRLDEQLDSLLYVHNDNNAIEGVISDLFAEPLSSLGGTLDPPAAWIDPSHDTFEVRLLFDMWPGGGMQSRCVEGEAPTADPTKRCNVNDGLVLLYSYDSGCWDSEPLADCGTTHGLGSFNWDG